MYKKSIAVKLHGYQLPCNFFYLLGLHETLKNEKKLHGYQIINFYIWLVY